MKGRIIFASILSSLLFFSCKQNIVSGSGDKTDDTRDVSSFTAVDISAPVNATINIKEGAASSVHLSGYKNLIGHIKTKVEGNTLRIYVENHVDMITDKKVDAEITVPSLWALSLSGAPDVQTHGNITGHDFKLDVSGASKVTIDDLNTPSFNVDLSGASDVEIKSGTVAHAEYDITGAGKVEAFPLETVETVAMLSGAGKCEVNVKQKLNAHVSGVGKISYKGHPVLNSDVSGVGKVVDAN